MYSPVPGAHMTTPYGKHGRHWASGRHTGADFAAAHGSLVRAVAPGKVISNADSGAYGNLVRVLHDDGTIGYYAHLSRISVRRGQRIDRGTMVGKVGSTGNSTGPHLHFEVRRGGRSVNPLAWMNADYAEVSDRTASGQAHVGQRGVDPTPAQPQVPAIATPGGGFKGTEFDIDEQLRIDLPAATGGNL